MTKKEALELSETKWWEGKTPKEIVSVQLFEDRVIMPFGDFVLSVEKVLGRSIWDLEFANPQFLRKEFLMLKGK